MAVAQAEEEALRDAAFIEGAMEICGVPIVPLTLEKMALLLFVGSPFLCGGRVEKAHVPQFLWILSPLYCPRNREARAAFTATLAQLSFSTTSRAIQSFIDEETMDRPASSGGHGTIPITSFVASYVDLFASAYGWSEPAILQTRMARLYQYLRHIQRRSDPKAIFFNRLTDRRRRELLAAFQKQTGLSLRGSGADTLRRK